MRRSYVGEQERSGNNERDWKWRFKSKVGTRAYMQTLQIFVGPNSNSDSCGWVTKSWAQLLLSLEYCYFYKMCQEMTVDDMLCVPGWYKIFIEVAEDRIKFTHTKFGQSKNLWIWPICWLQICSTEISIVRPHKAAEPATLRYLSSVNLYKLKDRWASGVKSIFLFYEWVYILWRLVQTENGYCYHIWA